MISGIASTYFTNSDALTNKKLWNILSRYIANSILGEVLPDYFFCEDCQ
jgi:hypothetical protein